MASQRTLRRLHSLVWILLYGGLLTLVLGLASRPYDQALAWCLMAFGGTVAVAGIVLIFVRARLQPDAEPTSRSNP